MNCETSITINGQRYAVDYIENGQFVCPKQEVKLPDRLPETGISIWFIFLLALLFTLAWGKYGK